MPNALPHTGTVVADKYLVETLIGRGGMGAVYVVLHRLTQKRLALKVLLPQFLDQPEIVERFLREAQSAGRIQHRHVVDVFDVGKDGDVLYIVMPLLSGKPLSTLLHEEQLSLNRLLTVLLRSMEGVAAAHAQGVVHRDLKPDNIYVCQGISGQLDDPKILDFGISRQAGAIDARLTQSGVMLGTPHYMAFEQIAGQRDLDERVDVYAMGAIMYEALAGVPPFDAESVGGLAVRMMSGPATPIDDRCPGLPLGLGDVIMRALEREREHRFQTMNAFIAALTPFLQPENVNERSTSSPRESVGHDPTLLALTPTPSATPRLSLQSGVRSNDSQPIPQRTLTISAHDDDARPTPTMHTRPSEGRGRSPVLWVVLAALALGVPWLGTRLRALWATPAASSEPVQPTPAQAAPAGIEAAKPVEAPSAAAPVAPAPVTPAPAAPVVSAPAEAKTPSDPLLPDPKKELSGAPVEGERGRRERGKRRENAAEEHGQNNLYDTSPTNPPLSAPSGEGPVAPEPAPVHAPEPAPAPAAEPTPAAAEPAPAPAADPAAP